MSIWQLKIKYFAFLWLFYQLFDCYFFIDCIYHLSIDTYCFTYFIMFRFSFFDCLTFECSEKREKWSVSLETFQQKNHQVISFFFFIWPIEEEPQRRMKRLNYNLLLITKIQWGCFIIKYLKTTNSQNEGR